MPSKKPQQELWYKDIDLLGVDLVRQCGAYEWVEEKIIKTYVQQSVHSTKPVYTKTMRGFFETKNRKKIVDFFTKDRILVFTKFDNEYTENSEDYLYLGPDDIVSLGFGSEDSVGVEVLTHDKKFLKKCETFMGKVLTKRSKDNLGKAHVLAQGYEGLVTKEIGAVAVPLQLENYTASVREGLQEVIDDLKSPLPNGKLSIFNGPPGTGKTYLIRQLISEIPTAFFVIIPPAMVGKLGDPSIIPVLLRLKSRDDDLTDEELMENERDSEVSNPIVLIVEDADDVLVKREHGDMASISTVLNLTSGILGDLLDIRIIATTNAKKTDLDDALTRDGRMSYHLHVGKVTFKEACDIYARLMGDTKAEYQGEDTKDGVLLATVYKAAKNAGYRDDPKKTSKPRSNSPRSGNKRRIGFHTPEVF